MNNCNNELFDDDNCRNPHHRPMQRIYCIGPTGATGPTGPAGPTTITVGTTTTSTPGSSASVTNSGTTQDVILDFAIPSGATGPQGLQGITGPTETYMNIYKANDYNYNFILSIILLTKLEMHPSFLNITKKFISEILYKCI